jgi:hypothetical protein
VLPDEVSGETHVITPSAKAEETRREIVAEVVAGVRTSPAPVPLEALADRGAARARPREDHRHRLGRRRELFELLRQQAAPGHLSMTKEPPYLAFDTKRHGE